MRVGSGDDKKVWHLPEKLLKSNSTFFTAALESGFAEGISTIIPLPDQNPDIFRYFVDWLYVGLDQSAIIIPDFLVPLWALGDRLGCPLMQNDAMGRLITYYDGPHIGEVTLKQIYELSAPKSKLRLFAVNQCLFDVRQHCPDGHENGGSYLQFVKDNEDFARQLAEATVLLGSEDQNHPSYNRSPYLCGPSPCTSRRRSAS